MKKKHFAILAVGAAIAGALSFAGSQKTGSLSDEGSIGAESASSSSAS